MRGGHVVKCDVSERIDGICGIRGDSKVERKEPALCSEGGVGCNAVPK
jgi:hypothetical protein